jgi:hypothetical protein
MENTSGIKTWQWVVTVIVIIALIVIGVMVFGGKSAETPTLGENPTATSTDQNGAANRIVMTDQYPGNIVYLSSVQVATSSWVVIHADNSGVPGKVIGSAHFDAGINPGKVTLSESMIDGKTYYAVIYTDNGSGKFDATKDVPLKDSNGQVIMKIFKASSTVSAGLKG